MKIYEYTDQRALVRDLLSEAKRSRPELSFQKLAEAVEISASFLSQVMAGDQEFSNDQIYAIGHFFELDAEALDYLVLLNEYQRCQAAERKKILWKEIQTIQDQHLRIVEYMSFERVDTGSTPMDAFLCDPLAPILDSQLTVEKNLKNPSRLKKILNVDEKRLEQGINILREARIVENEGEGLKRVVGETMAYNINAAAKFNAVYSRLKAVDRIFAEDPSDLITTLIFCANDEFVKKQKARILEFQNKMLDDYPELRKEIVYFVNVDFFAIGGN